MANNNAVTVDGAVAMTGLIQTDYEELFAGAIKQVKRNGTVLPITSQSVDVEVPTKVSTLQNDAGYLVAADIAGKANTADVYPKTQTYNTTEIDNKIKAAQVGAVRPMGSYDTFAALTAAVTNPSPGDMYNIKNAGGTDVYGDKIKAGDNVVYYGAPTNGWDAQGGTVDLSDYPNLAAMNAALANKVDKVTGKGLSTNDFTTDLKNKLAGIFAGATKVEKSNTNGNIKINGAETLVYTLPTDVLRTSNLATTAEVSAAVSAILNA